MSMTEGLRAQPDGEYVIAFDVSDDRVFDVAQDVADCNGRSLVADVTRRVGPNGEPVVCCMGFDRSTAERIVARLGVEFPWHKKAKWQLTTPVLLLTDVQVMPLMISREPVAL